VTQVASTKQQVAEGTSIAAGAVLITVGVLDFLQGISALANDELFVVGVQYVYSFDLTTWGWIHLILGIGLALVGAALFTGATWARAAAVVVLSLSIVANFLSLPYYPWWSVIVIALAIVGLWGLATWNPDRA
jgi:hypothetical protein